MLKKILVLIIAGVLGISYSSLSWAGSGDAAALASKPTISAAASDAEGYLIGPGDVLDISVWKDEALTRSCVVRPDGFISFPLIGDVRAADRTVSSLKAEMEKKIDPYVPQATISLEVKQVNSLIIFVVGKVNAPGRIIMNAEVDVMQALATAGGLTVFAKSNKIKIFRHEKNETTIFPFNYDEVVDGIRLEQNIRLKRGDIVVIP